MEIPVANFVLLHMNLTAPQSLLVVRDEWADYVNERAPEISKILVGSKNVARDRNMDNGLDHVAISTYE